LIIGKAGNGRKPFAGLMILQGERRDFVFTEGKMVCRMTGRQRW